MVKVEEMRKQGKALRKFKWRYPDADKLPLRFSIADSVLKEFVLGHSPSAVLIELVQNEYDAEGIRLEMLFGEDSVTITGNGKPVDRAGWGRLSVVLGTGNVAGSDRKIKAKVNSIGSKNFGLRSLFIYGDQIYIRSGGQQTVLDIDRGTLPKPLHERSSRYRLGIHIEVPFRTITRGDMEAFHVRKESQMLDRFSRDMMPMLIKLANPDSPKSLQELVVYSKRCHRRITWKQSVTTVASSNRSVKVLHRTITMKDSSNAEHPSKHVQSLEEIEFQKNFRIPEQFRQQNIPNYFKVTGGRIFLALSMRIKRGRIDLSEPGLFYYPLGLIHAYTGTGISINAPFQLDDDRTRIIDPENSQWNKWLLERATDLTFELLVSDWTKRFGHQVYLALNEITHPAITDYLASVASRLETEACWPTRAHRRGHIKFVTAEDIVIPVDRNLDGFLSEERYLDNQLAGIPEIRDMACRCGAKVFTINSLVRLRCFGEEETGISTELSGEEANRYYTDFPDAVEDEDRQIKFAIALDSQRRKLTEGNRIDLCNSATTMAADGSLRTPVSPLWVVDPTITDVCPVPKGQQLHPSLVTSNTIMGLCRRFDGSDWTRKTAQRIQGGEATEEEREALYRYILSVHGQLGRNTKALLRRLPVLHDHRGEWVAPYQIIAKKSTMAKRLEAVMHFPNRDYAGDSDLVRAFRFKQRIEGNDIVEYSELVKHRPELAEGFEETLQKLGKLLNRPVVKKLSQVPFLRDSTGGISAPIELYIRNKLNYLCLGDKAPFVQGSRVNLYKLLGCRDKPKAEDMVSYIKELSENNQKLEQPEVIYATLVSALRAKGLPSDYYSEEPIIWDGSHYSSPEDTLLGSRYSRIFLDAVPCIPVFSSKLREVFLSLGVHAEPQEKHWRQLLVGFGHKYQEPAEPVPESERRVLRNAYRKLSGVPEGLPDDAKCFLDRNGMLHSMTDIRQERLLNDDDPEMAQTVIEQGILLSFVDTSEHGTLAFFLSAGVKSLTEVRQRKGVVIGEESRPPRWFNPQPIFQQVHSSEFSSALFALAEHELAGSASNNLIAPYDLERRLNAIQRISFAKEIRGIYTICNHTIHTSEDFALNEDSVTLLRVRSHSELYGLLAQVISTIIIDDMIHQRVLSDAIYRLLTCRSIREMKSYLNSRGVPWRPTSRALEDWEEAEEDEYGLSGDEIDSMITNILKQSIAKGKTGDVGDLAPKPPLKESTGKEPTTPTPKAFSLPPFGSIEVNRLEPSETWTPPVPKGGGKGGSSFWTPPEPVDEEWEREVGRRGEEIIYKQELEHVRVIGYPESRIVWESDRNPEADFDILSVDDDGENLWIEVKSTTGRDGRFRWPKTEFKKAIEKRNKYILWRVYEAHTKKPSVKPFRDPIGILLRQGMRLDIDKFYAMVEPIQA